MEQKLPLENKEHIDALITEETPESRTLEYKSCLSTSGTEDKKELLADVSSFANSAGGYLLYGIEEKRDGTGKSTGIPSHVSGVKNADGEKQRLESILRTGVDPRIPGITIGQIGGFQSGSVIVLSIPKSWMAPHMVTLGGTSRFYARNSSGKYPLDVREIKSAFALSEEFPAQLRRFRDERLSNLLQGETPLPMVGSQFIAFHAYPMEAANSAYSLTSDTMLQKSRLLEICTYGVGSSRRLNLDGLLIFSRFDSGETVQYTQLFRNGAIEIVDSYLLSRPMKPNIISGGLIEKELICHTTKYIQFLKELNIGAPIVFFLSLLGVRGYILTHSDHFSPKDYEAIDRENLVLPETRVEDLSQDVDQMLKDLFDLMWQSSGYIQSPHYGRDGRRNSR